MKTKTIYSLKVHTQLAIKGFKPICTMPNPKKEQYNCWIYEDSIELEDAFREIINQKEASYGK